MRVGISSSCFYPLETERSLQLVGAAGAKVTEVFFNAPSELEGPLLRELCAIRDHYGMEIASIHPFMSFAEGFWLFDRYARRFHDCLPWYEMMFDAGAALGATWFVLHGAHRLVIDRADYAERFGVLAQLARRHGLRLAHENVVHYVGERPAFMAYLQAQLGDDFAMVLDLKQARRAGEDPFAFLRLVGARVVHVHASDGDALHDCLPPGRGTFDFPRLFAALEGVGYTGKYLIELYRDNFTDAAELTQAQAYLRKLLGEKEA